MGSDVDDGYLVQRAQEGYLDAYAELVDRHGAAGLPCRPPAAGQPSRRRGRRSGSAGHRLAAASPIQGESSFSTWLYQIVTRRALNRITRTRRTESLDLLGEVSDAGDGPASMMERNLTVDAVTDAVSALPPAQRIAIVLRHFEGLSNAEIADITGNSVSAVRSHLFRGRRTLTKTLKDWR